jgi:hypothetical protein
VLGPTGGPGGPAQARPRRRLRTLALVVAMAAVIGGGAAVGYQQWQSRQQDSGAGTVPTQSETSAANTPAPDGTVPDNWERYDDPLGFSLSLPKGWKRTVYRPKGGVQVDFKQVDYSPDGGLHFVRIAVDPNPDFASAYQHQLDLEQQIDGLVAYKRVTMKENTYRDCKGSRWEYTWNAQKKDPPFVAGPRRAVEETYISRRGTEYAIYISTPAGDWGRTSKQFKWVLQSWQPHEG